MAVAFRSAGAIGVHASGTPTVNYPAGVASGDLLLIHYTARTNATVPGTPAGWTKLLGPVSMSGSPGQAYVYYRVAGASEPSSVTFTVTGTAAQCCGIMTAYTGVDPAAPVDVFATANLPTTGTSGTTPSVTTTKANTMLLRLYWDFSASTTITPPGTDTERYDAFSGAAMNIVHQLATSTQAAVGASGTTTATFGSVTFGGLGATIALAPVVAAPVLEAAATVAATAAVTAAGALVGGTFTHIKFGTGLTVTDLGGGVIRVDVDA